LAIGRKCAEFLNKGAKHVGRVVITSAADVEPASPPILSGFSVTGAVKTRAVMATADRPLNLWFHDAEPGAVLAWENPAVGHVLYVWDGEVFADGKRIGKDSTIVIEHGGAIVLETGTQPATLAHFHRRETGADQPERDGGRVHIATAEGIYRCATPERHADYIIWADADCPSCKLWLHQTRFSKAGMRIRQHMHSEDEIILVREGSMVLGNRTLQPGTALAIDANTGYRFGTGPDGLAFINFRATDPWVIFLEGGKPVTEPISERENFKNDFAAVKAAAPDSVTAS
jgi:hypothetical protein